MVLGGGGGLEGLEHGPKMALLMILKTLCRFRDFGDYLLILFVDLFDSFLRFGFSWDQFGSFFCAFMWFWWCGG